MSRQAEANLSALIESTEDLLGSVDLDFRLRTFNGAFRRHVAGQFGARPNVGMRPKDFLPPDGAALWASFFQRALAEGFRVEYLLREGGTLELAFHPIVVDGKTTGISVFGKDITDRKAAEQSRRFLATMVDSSEDAIFAYSPTGAILTWNHGAEAIFGYKASEAIGRPFSTLVLPPTMPEVDQFTAQVIDGSTLYAKAGRGVRKDGRVIYVSVTTWPIRNVAGEVEAISIIARDVTQQREAEEAKLLLGAIVESSDAAIHAVGLDGTISSWNRGAELLTGYTSEEAIGKNVEMLLAPEDRMNVGPRLELIKSGAPIDSSEILLLRKDGSTIPACLSGSPIRDAQGKVIGTSVVARDITQQKLLHSKLVEAEKKYRSIFDGAVEGMFQTSLEGRILTANPALARMLGFDSPDDLISSVANVNHQGWGDSLDRSRFEQQMEDQNAIVGFECRLQRKDGAIIWALVSCHRVFDGKGEPLFVEGSIQDISEKKRIEIKLRESEGLYRETFEQAAIGITHTSFDAKILWCNARFAEIIGYPPEEVPGLPVERFTPLEFRKMTMGIIPSLASGAMKSTTLEKQFVRKDGTLRWAKVTVSSQCDENGRPHHLISFVEDIQARRDAERGLAQANEELRGSEARYRTVFETSPDLISITRVSDGVFVDVNLAVREILGYDREEILGHTSDELNIWVDPDDRRKVVELLRRDSRCRNREFAFRRKNGEIFSVLLSASTMEVDGVPCVVCFTRDISGVKAAEQQINNLAFYDPLTGLPNRRLLLDRLSQFPGAIASSRRKVALIFVDLDNFKSLNDTLGLQAGDFLLREVARRLTACVREYDTVARVGGDEFAVMLDKLSENLDDAAARARVVAEKILAVLREPFRFEGHEYHCPSSLGIDVFGSQPECTSDALQRAEIAMFQAKEAGRNTARFFSPTQQAAVSARAEMEERLRQGIKNNQFFLYYQPQIERGLLTGVEALIRWKHPVRGFIMPDEFIPLAEQTGLILQLGELALETACSQLVAWASRKETSHLTLAVNISPRHLGQPDFVEQVMTIVNRIGARPENLRLELTESMLSHSVDDTVAKMRELRSHGVRFSLDDFGTGYSSLAYLKQLPISRLKIDRAFVKDILVDAASGAIAQTIISLGRALDLSVIAEGVETEEQRGFLAGMGCHSYQGYLFSRPLPVMEFERFLAEFSNKHPGAGQNPALPAGIPLEI